jgi:hypothetical protein
MLRAPVSAAIALLLVLVWVCTKCDVMRVRASRTLANQLLSSVEHDSVVHLAMSLVGLYLTSRMEIDYGSPLFAALVLCALLLSAMLEFSFRMVSKTTPWSIGFGGVIIALATFNLMDAPSLRAFGFLLLIILYPNLTNPEASLTGHLSGAAAGLLLYTAASACLVGRKKCPPRKLVNILDTLPPGKIATQR